MITWQGAGAIIPGKGGSVLLVRTERRGMLRWELPTAIRKGGESLLLTVFRCVEEESGFRFKARIVRPVCLGLNISDQLDKSYFGMFFECTAENVAAPGGKVTEEIEDLPDAARQKTLDFRYVEWRKLKPRQLHPQHRAILEKWASTSAGELFAIQSDADREVEFYDQGTAPASHIVTSAPEYPPAGSSVELKWIHVSDIHFGSLAKGLQAEKRLVLECLIEDVKRGCSDNRPDYLFVTGDVAYSGKSPQYGESHSWLKRLARAAGIGLGRVWLVPGNHDVRRDVVATSPALRALHAEARNNPHKLDEFIADGKKRGILESKLNTYSTWVRRNFRHIPSPLEWSTLLTTPSSKKVLLAGLCTVWVSDEEDGKPNQPGIWSNNMFVSRDCSFSVLKPPNKEWDLTLLLTHHPRSWLCRPSDSWLETMLRGTVVQLCGHVHEEFGGVLSPMGARLPYATLVGGAVHDHDGLRHSYSWGQLRFEARTGRWYLGWAPRVWARGEFVADRTNYFVDAKGYCWAPLGWPGGLQERAQPSNE